MATETLTLSQLEPRLSELVDRAHQSLDRFFITRNGHTDAVLLGAADFEGLVETLEILSDNEAVRELIQAEREFSQGEGHPIETINQELGV
jgi:prevent-host-death family protein